MKGEKQMEGVTTAVTNAGTLASTALTTIMGNPVLALGLGVSFLAAGIGLARKFLHIR